MTREQAIKIIRKELLCVDRDNCKREECKSCDLVMPSKEPIIEAYKMAIKALENQCPSKGVDCDDCPANKPKSKVGKWIVDHDAFSEINGYKLTCHCSECNHKKVFYDNKSITTPTLKNASFIYNYCPNCGAKMESEE